MQTATIIRVRELAFRLGSWTWPFSQERRADIAAHFDDLMRKNAALWNGRVFLLRRWEVSGWILRGEYFATDFASLIAWRDWGYADTSIRACFAMAALQGSDGGFLAGAMGAHTANAGMAQFPTGTPDPMDLDGDKVDLERSVCRELAEETGLTCHDFRVEPGWHAVFSGPHIALMKRLHATDTSATLREKVLDFLAREARPEFSAIHVLGPQDARRPPMPAYMSAFIEQVWRDEARTS